MGRKVPLSVAIAVIVFVVLVIVGIWVGRQYASRSYEERVRQEVEEQLYREGELGHPPGQPSVPAKR